MNANENGVNSTDIDIRRVHIADIVEWGKACLGKFPQRPAQSSELVLILEVLLYRHWHLLVEQANIFTVSILIRYHKSNSLCELIDACRVRSSAPPLPRYPRFWASDCSVSSKQATVSQSLNPL